MRFGWRRADDGCDGNLGGRAVSWSDVADCDVSRSPLGQSQLLTGPVFLLTQLTQLLSLSLIRDHCQHPGVQ